MTDIVFHIGLHKTATTTLQDQFFPACGNLNFIRGHGPHAPEFLEAVNRTDAAYFDAGKAMSGLASRLMDDKVNLMSSESFSWVSWSGAIAKGIDFRTQIIRNLASAVPNARIIIVLRRQDGMVRSLYRQYLQAGGTKPVDRVFGTDPEDLKTIVPRNYFRYSPYIGALKELFPAGVLILPFEELVRNQKGFLNKLADFIGIDCPDVELTRSNSSQLGYFGLEVTRWLNHLFRTGLNPAGMFPGFPVKRGNKWRRMTPSWWLHENWPFRGELSDSCSLSRRSLEIFERAHDDNRALDLEYSLGLSDYGYY